MFHIRCLTGFLIRISLNKPSNHLLKTKEYQGFRHKVYALSGKLNADTIGLTLSLLSLFSLCSVLPNKTSFNKG